MEVMGIDRRHQRFWDRATWLYNEVPYESLEGDLFGIWEVHLDLTIAAETIHEGENGIPTVGSTSMFILSNRNSTFGHALFRSRKFIQQRLSILLLHRNYVSEPGRVPNGFDETNVQKFLEFLFDLHLELWLKVPMSLFGRPSSFFDVDFMCDQLWV